MEIYVGNLAYATTDDGLKAAFAQFGEVTAVRVVTDRMTGRSKGFGFVTMPDATQAQAAIDAAVEKARQWFVMKEGAALQEQTVREEAQEPSTVFLKVDGAYRQVALDDILYVSGMKDYVMFYVTDSRKPLITHLTMKTVEEMLPAGQFMRVNRSYIVALGRIRSVDRNDCIYIGDEIIRVTDAYRDQFDSFLQSRFPKGK